ncbi:hypothetical protein ACG97_00400 [Vogesella sp. EB]|uniref:hypothetical protein n=1 Tax=Vogesella sp. EB TaxID=1526735 RepID=UPI00064D02E2|nr:hypothetical protein [Vogesella sp. EB]KMJ54782.1 hypothetical protein ACG97_00400 [Vogesella sp. EB]
MMMGKFKEFLRCLAEPSSAAGAAAILSNVAGLAAGSISAAVAVPAIFLGALAVFLPETANKTLQNGVANE